MPLSDRNGCWGLLWELLSINKRIVLYLQLWLLRLVPKVSSLEPFFYLKEGGNRNHRMKERHRGNFIVNV